MSEKSISDDELAAMMPSIKKMMQENIEKTKKKSDRFPNSEARAMAYKTACMQYNAFLRVVEICGRLAVQSQLLSEDADDLKQEIEDQRDSQKKDIPKNALN